VVLWWSRGGSGGRAVVTRWLRFSVANYSVHLLFVCAVVLWWLRGGSVVVRGSGQGGCFHIFG